MLKGRILIIIVIISISLSCAPSVQYQGKSYLRDKQTTINDISVLDEDSDIPLNAKILGSVYIGDSGLSIGCSFDEVINIAKRKAVEVGGDAIYLTEIISPDFSSTCYRIR
ncbi:MAG: hypothetical protein GF353_00725, partial [Candidatus Lokiarchaeota archaeon]|nr:hypothetical protein [Candidatus Lokiarchaeota archaeon]